MSEMYISIVEKKDILGKILIFITSLLLLKHLGKKYRPMTHRAIR